MFTELQQYSSVSLVIGHETNMLQDEL